MSNLCPVCGYSHLDEPAYYANDPVRGNGSQEICPSCGFQFGYTDHAQHVAFKQWREQWIARGMPWRSKDISPPLNWNPAQ